MNSLRRIDSSHLGGACAHCFSTVRPVLFGFLMKAENGSELLFRCYDGGRTARWRDLHASKAKPRGRQREQMTCLVVSYGA